MGLNNYQQLAFFEKATAVGIATTLVAGAGIVVGALFQTGNESMQNFGTEIMQCSGITFAGLLGLMCICFTINSCIKGERRVPVPVDLLIPVAFEGDGRRMM